MTLDELKQFTIDNYVSLLRIKEFDTQDNPELNYQLKVMRGKLAALGIPAVDFEK